jgi:hypothetical protein
MGQITEHLPTIPNTFRFLFFAYFMTLTILMLISYSSFPPPTESTKIPSLEVGF